MRKAREGKEGEKRKSAEGKEIRDESTNARSTYLSSKVLLIDSSRRIITLVRTVKRAFPWRWKRAGNGEGEREEMKNDRRTEEAT